MKSHHNYVKLGQIFFFLFSAKSIIFCTLDLGKPNKLLTVNNIFPVMNVSKAKVSLN